MSSDYNELAMKIREILTQYTRLPDAIIQVQCKSIGKTPKDITKSDLNALSERIGKALALFTNPAKGESATHQIRLL